jgi:hypothetical protein
VGTVLGHVLVAFSRLLDSERHRRAPTLARETATVA